MLVDHLISVAVIGGQKQLPAGGQDFRDDAAHTGVDCLDRLDGRLEMAGMSDHVGVGKVEDDTIVFRRSDGLDDLIRHGEGAHFRLQIVSGHLRRRNQQTILMRIRLFDPAVKEEGHVRILFRLRDAQLPEALSRKVFAEGIFDRFRRKGHADARHRRVILRHADVAEIFYLRSTGVAVETVKILIDEATGDFPRPVGPEIAEDHAVTGFDRSIFIADSRQDKLVCLIGGVSGVDSRRRRSGMTALAQRQRFIGQLDAFPALVAVHGIIAAGDYTDRSARYLSQKGFQLLDISEPGSRRHIAPVHEAVHVNRGNVLRSSQRNRRLDVIDVAVHAAVGNKTHDVQGAARPAAVLQRLAQRLVSKKAAILDGLADPGQFLIDHAAGADVEVTDL